MKASKRHLPDVVCFYSKDAKNKSTVVEYCERTSPIFLFLYFVFHCESKCMPGEQADNVNCSPLVFLLYVTFDLASLREILSL